MLNDAYLNIFLIIILTWKKIHKVYNNSFVYIECTVFYLSPHTKKGTWNIYIR